MLEHASGLRGGEDFFLSSLLSASTPEIRGIRLSNTPKLVGGICPESTRLGSMLYEARVDEVVPVSSPEVAELAKLVENTFRFINISFINEVALLCDRMGINVWEVIEAAKTKPFAFMAHYPSAGVWPLHSRRASIPRGGCP
jgi:UDP-N-acetyl-D-glucosamine dehydrogenase